MLESPSSSATPKAINAAANAWKAIRLVIDIFHRPNNLDMGTGELGFF